MANIKIDELLGKLKSDKTPEVIFQEKLAEVKTPESGLEPPAAIPDYGTGNEPLDEDLAKIAEHYVEQGRLIAHGFYSELTKLANEESQLTNIPELATGNDETDEAAKQILYNLYLKYYGGTQ